MSSITLTREQLYERVWSQPTIKIAAELGLSDVAVKKMCRRMNVPTPPRGYWARLAAGQKLRKPALPKDASINPVRIDPTHNARRREDRERLAAGQALMTPLELPDLAIGQLHPQARALHAVLKKAKPDPSGRVDAPVGDFPLVHVSAANIDRVSRAFHVIFSELESRGVALKQVSIYDRQHLGFVRGEDEAALMFEEPIVSIKREPTLEERRRPSREWKTETTQPSGQFKVTGFTLYRYAYSSHGSMQRGFNRNEGPRRPIGMLLREIVDQIWEYFIRQDEAREQKKKEAAAEAERQKAEAERKRLAAEARAAETARRKEEERLEQHRQKLTALAAARVENALRAAEWWRLNQVLLAYAAECERHWQTQQPRAATLTEDQTNWLAWLRREASAMSPFALGYPDFAKDGPFDGTGIPIDGPYPPITTLPLPPTMPAPSEPAPPKETPKTPPAPPPPAATYSPPQPQFPFWLLHRNRH